MTIAAAPAPAPGHAGAGGALQPVRAWLLAAAHAEAEQVRAVAAADADRVLARARAEAEAILTEAREQGIADGAALAAAERARHRRRARGLVLEAERWAYEELRARSRAAVRALREDPCYPTLRERLTRLALAAAGPGATAGEHPDGGVVVEAPGVRVDCTLDGLAARAVDALGGEVVGLWTR
jgi:cell division septum initiation protein DivIVA